MILDAWPLPRRTDPLIGAGSTWRVQIVLTAICLVCWLATGATEQGLVLEQVANGLPGRGLQDAGVHQRILVTRDRLRLDEAGPGVSFLFRLDEDPPQVYEISPDRKEYRVGDDFADVQSARDRFERQLLQQLRGESEEERQATIDSQHLRPDGSREVTVEVEPDAGRLLGYPVARYVVRENGRVVVDVHTTTELGIEIPFFEFYRRVGAFSDQVLDKLRGIRGVPLKADFTVITATLNYVIQAQVERVEPRAIDAREFELPTGARRHVEGPFAPCVECAREVERSAPPYKLILDSRLYLFCSKACIDAAKARRYGRTQ